MHLSDRKLDLDRFSVGIYDERVVSFIPPPITPPDGDLELLYPTHEVLLTEDWERPLEPEHLRKEVHLFYERKLPGLEVVEVIKLGLVTEGLVHVVVMGGRSCQGAVEEVMFFCGDWEMVSFEVYFSAGEEERDVDFSFASIPRACVLRVQGPDGRIIGFGELLNGVEEYLISNLSRNCAIVERRVLLGIDLKLAFKDWKMFLW